MDACSGIVWRQVNAGTYSRLDFPLPSRFYYGTNPLPNPISLQACRYFCYHRGHRFCCVSLNAKFMFNVAPAHMRVARQRSKCRIRPLPVRAPCIMLYLSCPTCCHATHLGPPHFPRGIFSHRCPCSRPTFTQSNGSILERENCADPPQCDLDHRQWLVGSANQV